MDERRTPRQDPPPDRHDVSGLVGWGLLVALAVGILVIRLLGGGC